MIKLLVLADDFTGALDTGVQFSKKGIVTEVTTDINVDFCNNTEVDVLVIDTESRYLEYDESYKLHLDILSRARACGIPHFYKKLDSALRGNISSDIAAVRTSFPERTISLIPAYPEIDRIVKNGVLYIEGSPVSESRFAEDPYEPVFESNILKRLSDEAGINGRLISTLDKALNDSSLNLFDAQTIEDMSNIGELLRKNRMLDITIGCASFAEVLSGLLFDSKISYSPEIKSPLIVLCGSVNRTTQKQVNYAENIGHKRYSLEAKQLLTENYWNTKEGQNELNAILALCRPEEVIIFETFSDKATKTLNKIQAERGISKIELRQMIGKSLGELSKKLLLSDFDRTYLFTGGDTLYQCMREIGITKIRPTLEYSPGIVLSEISWQNKQYQVLTKSGGFGDKDLFVKIQNDFFKKEKTC